MLSAFAPAKVNLYLHVVGRRPDGYHLLDSVAVFAGIGDCLSAKPAADFSLRIQGPFAAGLAAEADNLVLRAGAALAASAGVTPRGRLLLEKRLPVASGIGGGSADAAAALRLLSRLWDIHPTPEQLASIAATLGADVPVCLACRPAHMAGIGDILTPLPALPAYGMVLINPGVAVATQAVFKHRSGPFSAPVTMPDRFADAGALAAWLHRTGNDLEPPARSLAPVIGDVLHALSADRRCLLARMSGSGATCFGLYETPEIARLAAQALEAPGWWVWGGGASPVAGDGVPAAS
jgi:4-diphosphocytidyl-2-C-methyl-D-erythritol kinase